MKRLFLGIAWFLILFAGLWLLVSLAMAIAILRSLPANSDQAAMIQAATDYASVHAETIHVVHLAVLVLAAVLAILGTLKGKLPGTRKAADPKP